MHPDFLTHDIQILNLPGSGAPPAIPMLEREWLLTNGTGAFAMGTVTGANTRRYHGLLIASERPPVGRVMLLNQVLERIVIDGKTIEPTTCLFRDGAGKTVAVPEGHTMLRRFRRGISVEWTYSHDLVDMTRELHLHWKQQAATLRYRVTLKGAAAGKEAQLQLWPMVTLRDFHALLRRDDMGSLSAAQAGALSKQQEAALLDNLSRPPTTRRADDTVVVRRQQLALTLCSPGSRFIDKAESWNAIYYPVDNERGQEDHEDHFLPGYFQVAIKPGGATEAFMTATLGERAVMSGPSDDAPRVAHLQPIAATLTAALQPSPAVKEHESLSRILAIASDDFVVDRFFKKQKLATIIAGYPWFADWGRDTFIALPGLLLTTGRFDEARSCLRTFANVIHDGLVPNVFNDYDDTAASYNTVDASLWFVHAAMQYVQASGDEAAWNEWLCTACVSIIEAYIKGTSAGEGAPIRMAGDGLITAGSATSQLTWMDASCGGKVFTPRQGKAVEINALWFHVLTGMSETLTKTPPMDAARGQHYAKLADRIGRSFGKVFWDEDRGYLCDHVWADESGQEFRDTSLRPNQVFAVSLPNSPIPRTRQVAVMRHITDKLLTPVGLRTLAENDPQYHALYTGPQMQRDEAYHQGTIWAWLIGPYAEAVLRAGRFSDKSRQEALAALTPLIKQMTGVPRAGSIGELPEIYEARDPHRPVGAMAQAWSVAEVTRVLALCATGKAV